MNTGRFISIVVAGFATLGGATLRADAQTSPPSGSRDDPGGTAGGERFTVRTVVDHQQGDLPVETFSAPQTWTDRSETRWNLADTMNPASVVFAVENGATGEALFTYPAAEFVAVPGAQREGPSAHGRMWGNPVPADQALSAYAQRARGSLPQFRIVGSHDAPNLPALRQMDATQHPRGIAVRVAYELGGKPVEEEFYAAYHLASACSKIAAGRACETDWGLYDPFSFRAPAGTLDRRLPVFSQIVGSRRLNPEWARRAGAVRAQLLARANQSIQAHSARSEAARQRANQIVANSNAFLAQEDQRHRAILSSGSGAPGAPRRSTQDKIDDYLRGVTTLDDPKTGTTQRSSDYSYHWTDGNGSYRDSNDGSYDPNKTENGTWHLMQETQ